MRLVQVAIPVPIPNCFTYLAPKDTLLGSVVLVPFGKRTLWGVILTEGSKTSSRTCHKTIKIVIPVVQFSEGMRIFLQKMALYTVSPIGSLIKMALPAVDYNRLLNYSVKHLEFVKNKEHKKALEESHGQSGSLSFWAKRAHAASKTVDQWVQQGVLTESLPLNTQQTIKYNARLFLSQSQQKAFEQIECIFAKNIPSTLLLEGVTGSGKTEVALALCKKIWEQGKQVLVLLPEIILSHQWEKRCEKYFQIPRAVWHSGLSVSARQDMFAKITQGQALLTIGARSALFLPYKNLGLIIVDEEHEVGYKQNDGVLYHGRDMAIYQGFFEKIPVLLMSATPSLETMHNVSLGRYHHVHLEKRHGAAKPPLFHMIDMRNYPPKEKAWISPPLRQALTENLAQGNQSLLFLNRRGYACLLMCYRCGYRGACPNCSVWLTIHGSPKQLLCHYCGFTKPLPTECPGCSQVDALVLAGPGIEKLKEEVATFLPKARVSLFSSDNLSSPKIMDTEIQKVIHREVDILIGTQIVAKGHHFPHLTCIGIIDADFILADIDFRASERLFQLFYQVSGRAGREDLAGHTYVQTLRPEEPFFLPLSTYNWNSFVQEELQKRHEHNFPPWSKMAMITISGRCELEVQSAALKLQQHAPNFHKDVFIYGPAPALLTPLRGRHRWRFIIKVNLTVSLQTLITKWIEKINFPKSIKLEIDINPYHFL